MRIQKIELSNFQCFGSKQTSIELEEDITCLIGNNGSGKSAVIKAIQRLFGNTLEDRTIIKSDFHICPNETEADIKGKQLYIDVFFEFKDKDEAEIFAFFSSVIYETKEKKFCARMRLEATWSEEEYEDEVSAALYWILTEDNSIEFGEDSPLKIKVENHERRQISLIHIPATRDAKSILKNEIRHIIKKIERYADIPENQKTDIETDSKKLGGKISDIEAIKSIQEVIDSCWKKAHDNTLKHYQDVRLQVVAGKFEDLIKSLLLKLCPGEISEVKDIIELSDGQISLLYFSLAIALYDLETKHAEGNLKGLREQDYDAPIFTILALEEPENHLSPFYLSRIMSLLEEKSKSNRVINLITSHSTNVVRRMKRVEQIRFLRQETTEQERKSVISKILLPERRGENDYKYINEAVLAHPELYFAKLVVLGEGDSEEIVLPMIAQKSGYDFDSSFVSFVQLGGRHVNHMWRLLEDLYIPYITLLDYDLGRYGGGENRLKEILAKLELPETETIEQLEKRDIFFSYPLDLDMMMIEKFPEFYIDSGRKSPHQDLILAVFGENGNEDVYSKSNIPTFSEELLVKYRYLFKTKSKVASHYLASDSIKNMDKIDFFEKRPEILGKIVKRIREILNVSESKQELDYKTYLEKKP